MKAIDVGFLKTYLLNQKSSILNKTLEFKASQLESNGVLADDSEAVSRDLSMNVSIQLHERDRLSLMQIERALAKIDNGSYGMCEGCADLIEEKRLNARPLATLCLACMEEQEDQKDQKAQKDPTRDLLN